MTPHSHASDRLVNLSAELASAILPFATDYPLVQVLADVAGPAMAWHYAELVVEVFVAQASPGRLLKQELGGVAVETSSLSDAMTLLRLTEAHIQDAEWPYVRLA